MSINQINDEIVKILEVMKDILSAGWRQGANAKDINGNAIASSDDNAVVFSIVGAFSRAIKRCYDKLSFKYDTHHAHVFSILHFLLNKGIFKNKIQVIVWEDKPERVAVDVLQLIDSAINLFDTDINKWNNLCHVDHNKWNCSPCC